MTAPEQLRASEAASEAELERTPAPAYTETGKDTPRLRPLVAEPWQRHNIAATLRRHAGLRWYQARFHAYRAHFYAYVTVKYAAQGVWHAGRGLAAWLTWHHGWVLESQAVARGPAGHHDAMAANKRRTDVTSARWKITAAVAAVVVILAAILAHYAPWWGWALVAFALVAVFARHGQQKAGKPIVHTAVVPSQYEKLTPDILIRALGSLGLAGIDKVLREGKDIVFVTPVTRDGPGWRVAIDLPYGVVATDVIERRDRLASGLRRPAGCVWPEPDPDEHAGRLVLYVGDQPLSKMRQPAWPLASAPRVSMFDRIPFGTDQRGQPVTIGLMFANLLVGAISRMGKTVALRNVLLAAALDPLAELHVWELKGTGDLEPLARVAHAYGSGADDDTIANCLADLRRVHAELDRRAKVIKGLPREQCPDSKVTPQLAARASLGLRPLVFGLDECQEAYSHPEYGAEFDRLSTAVIRRGPALGIMLVLATQRPDARSLPTGVTANVAMRFCLRVMDQVANDMVLGTSAYRRGINAAMFGIADKGIGWAIGFSDDVHAQVVKSYDVNGPAAEKVCVRARAAREAAGLLTGQAASDASGQPAPQDVLGDVAAVFGRSAALQWPVLATRLAAAFPDRWAGATAESVSAQCRALGVPSVDVKNSGRTLKGCRREAVDSLRSTS